MRIPQSTFLSMDASNGPATARSQSSQSSSYYSVSSRSVSAVSDARAARHETTSSPNDTFNTTALWIWIFGMVLGVLGFIAIQFETLCTDVPANEDANQTIAFALERHKTGSTPALITSTSKASLPILSSPT